MMDGTPQTASDGPRWITVLLVSVAVFCVILFLFAGSILFKKSNMSGKRTRNQSLQSFTVNDDADFEDLAFDGQESQKDEADSNDVPDSTNAVLPTGVGQEASERSQHIPSWETFQSRALPISFSYPSDWHLWEGTTPLSDMIQIGDYIPKEEIAFTGVVPGHKLEIGVIELPLDQPLEQWIKQTDHEFFDVESTIENVKVDGFPAKLDYLTAGSSTFSTVYIPLGDGTDRIILIALLGNAKNFEELRPLLQGILSSVHIN